MRAALFAAACLAAVPVAYAAAAAGATVWYERRYLPTIAGDE